MSHERTGMPEEEKSDERIIEAVGRTRVIIRNGRVVSAGEPLIRECPLTSALEDRFTRSRPSLILLIPFPILLFVLHEL